jgi:hypothetical protein
MRRLKLTLIQNAASLQMEIASFKKESWDLKRMKTGLSQALAVAKAEIIGMWKVAGCCSKPIQRALESHFSQRMEHQAAVLAWGEC